MEPIFYLGRLLGIQNSACMDILFCGSVLHDEQEESRLLAVDITKVIREIDTSTFGS